MRIRKGAKISPLHYYASSPFLQQHGAILQAQRCQLNQSPWDVITFPIEDVENNNIINHHTVLLPPPPPPPPPAPSSSSYKLDGYDSCAVNGTFYDSEQSSITTMKLETNDSEMNCFDNNIIANVPADCGDFDKNEQNDNIVTTMCCKNDGKGWQCSRESKIGHNLCEHHFAQKHCSSSSNNSSHSTTITAAANSDTKINAAETTHSSRGRPHRPKKSSSSEFYYYSGFGPLWGKKRGQSTDKSTHGAQSSSSQMDNEGFDYIEDDEDDNDDEVENCKTKIKRARKPIKARSLKSLM